MPVYAAEQSQDTDNGRAMDEDLRPWITETLQADIIFSEFPYHVYLSDDHSKVQDAAERRGIKPSELHSDYIRQKGPFRTDLVGVSANMAGLRERAVRVGNLIPLNQPKQGKRRYRRTYLNFVKDGPMTREYYENWHGSAKKGPEQEQRSYSKGVSSTAFAWLKERNFLRQHPNGGWDAVSLPLVINEAHAIELKIYPNEWKKALKQAARANVYADFRWVVYDAEGVHKAEKAKDKFQNYGVGLVSLSQNNVEIITKPKRSTPRIDNNLLNRYMVEIWDLNERVLSEIETDFLYTPDSPPDNPPLIHGPDAKVRGKFL